MSPGAERGAAREDRSGATRSRGAAGDLAPAQGSGHRLDSDARRVRRAGARLHRGRRAAAGPRGRGRGPRGFPRDVALRQARGPRAGAQRQHRGSQPRARAAAARGRSPRGRDARACWHAPTRTWRSAHGRPGAPTWTRRCAMYGEAYARSRSYWTGINVATLAVLQGDREQSVAVARQVMADCRVELARCRPSIPTATGCSRRSARPRSAWATGRRPRTGTGRRGDVAGIVSAT
jgi:hypothetical protein